MPAGISMEGSAKGAHRSVLEKAVSLHRMGRLREAAALYREVLQQNPENHDAYYFLGVAEFQSGNFAAALANFDSAVAMGPDNVGYYLGRGSALQQLGRLDDALSTYDHALTIRPNVAEIYHNRGNVLCDLKRFEEAVASYDQALALNPAIAEAANNRGNALCALGRDDSGLASYERAAAIKPDYIEAYINRGNVLGRFKRFEEALASYDRALAINSNVAVAHNNRGNTLKDMRRFAEALASYERALALNPDFAEAHHNRGVVLQELRQFDEAVASYDRALAIRPDFPFVPGERLYCKMAICDWAGLADDRDRLWRSIAAGEPVASPFSILGTSLPASLQRKCSEIYVRERFPGFNAPVAFSDRHGHKTIRVGYFSADFRDHPIAHLMAGLIEHHDRSRFEIIAFSFGPPSSDTMRARLKRAFDQFVDVDSMLDRDVALVARRHEIDIAVDLMGFTGGSRTAIFAARAAPVQVNYLGYPGTMAAPYMDYLIADPLLVPQDHQQHYAEKIVYLPHSYQVNDGARPISEHEFSRAEHALPEKGFVFCCFNNSTKITPEIFAVWMRLLRQVEGSVLWLPAGPEMAMRNVKAEAERRGVAVERLVFAPRLPDMADHLARLRCADLFLDTLPYNAHTTASDALWAGLPVLTCIGETFAGRVAASLLYAVGLSELITLRLDEYEGLAFELATNPERLAHFRERLAASRRTAPLFDTALFTKHIEAAYAAMWKQYRAGQPPAHIRTE